MSSDSFDPMYDPPSSYMSDDDLDVQARYEDQEEMETGTRWQCYLCDRGLSADQFQPRDNDVVQPWWSPKIVTEQLHPLPSHWKPMLQVLGHDAEPSEVEVARVRCDCCGMISRPSGDEEDEVEYLLSQRGWDPDQKHYFSRWLQLFRNEKSREELCNELAREDDERALQEEFERQEAEQRYLTFDIPIILGTCSASADPVVVTAEQLCSGTYILGTQGTGKSSLLAQIALQRMAQKDSVILIDPHGSLVDKILARMPAERLSDTYLVDLNDAWEHPFSLNIFYCGDSTSAAARSRTAGRVSRVFARLWPEVERGQFVDMALDYVTSTLIDNQNCTLADVPAWFNDAVPPEVLVRIRDSETRAFWRQTLPRLSSRDYEAQASPFLRRLRKLRRDVLLNSLLCNTEPILDIGEIVRKRQSLLIKLPVDDEVLGYAAKHVGVILFSLIHSVTFSDLPDDGSLGYTLLVDEFQHFVTNDFVKLFVGARKYGARLVLAHQYIGQLAPEGLSANRDGVQTAGTVVSFQTTPADASAMAPHYRSLEKNWSRSNIRVDVAEALKEHPDESVKTFAQRHVIPLIHASRGQLHRRWEREPDFYTIVNGRKMYLQSKTAGMTRETTQYPTRNFGWGSEKYDPEDTRHAVELVNDLLYDAQKNGRVDSAKRSAFIQSLAAIGRDVTSEELERRKTEIETRLRPVIDALIAEPLVQQTKFSVSTAEDALQKLDERYAFAKTRAGVYAIKTYDLPEAVSKAEIKSRRNQLLQRTRLAYCPSKGLPVDLAQRVAREETEQKDDSRLYKHGPTGAVGRSVREPDNTGSTPSVSPPQRPTIRRRSPKRE